MTAQPTPAEFRAAKAIAHWIDPDTWETRVARLAQIIADHRAPAPDTSTYDDVLRQRGLRVAFDQAADDATKLRIHCSEAVAEEREACCKSVCFGCRHDLEFVNGMHKIKDGIVPRGDEFRWIVCTALAIRRRNHA